MLIKTKIKIINMQTLNPSMAGRTDMRQVYNKLDRIERKMATKKELKNLIETVEILGNRKTMKQIAQSGEDIKHGRAKEINSAKDLHKEL